MLKSPRSVPKTLSFALNRHGMPKTSPTIPEVPEYNENDPKFNSSRQDGTLIEFEDSLNEKGEKKNKDYESIEKTMVGLFINGKDGSLERGELCRLHEKLGHLLESNTSPFLYEYYRNRILIRGMTLLREKVVPFNGSAELIPKLTDVWIHFFSQILPTLQCILYRIKPRRFLPSVRITAMIAFRDEVLLKTDFEETLKKIEKGKIPYEFIQMVTILENIMESFPPNKSKLILQRVAGSLVSPFLAYNGLYEQYDNSKFIVTSNEPSLNWRKKSCDVRRLSRPLSVQPKQMETLNQLFLSAIKKH